MGAKVPEQQERVLPAGRKEPLAQAVADLCSDLGSPLLETLICTVFEKIFKIQF